MDTSRPTIAIIGGTGDLGIGLARRCARAGLRTIIGSRTVEKALGAVEQLRITFADNKLGDNKQTLALEAADNATAAQRADIVVLTVPFASQLTMLEDIRAGLYGKILIDVTVPLVPPRVARVQLPLEGSAAQRAQQFLGESVRVVSAFQNVPALNLNSDDAVDCDVLVCGDDKYARTTVVALIESMGLRALHGGSLANSAAADALTSVLIFINKHYGGHAGIRITGITTET